MLSSKRRPKEKRLSEEDLRYIAEDMPSNVGRKSDSRSRLLCVQELLRYATDKNNGLKTDEIIKILSYRSVDKKVPSAPTVLEDIHAIADNNPFDMQIDIPARGKTEGIKCTSSILNDMQIRMLQNLVRASKFITQSQADDLRESLDRFLSYKDQDKIAGSVIVDKRRRTSDPDVLDASQKISEAIAKEKKVEFTYVHWNLNNKATPHGNDKSHTVKETPVNLIYSFGNYYVETWAEEKARKSNEIAINTHGKNAEDSTDEKATKNAYGENGDSARGDKCDKNTGGDIETENDENTAGRFMIRRLDRMRHVLVSAEDAIDNDEIAIRKKTVHERTKQTFDMLGGDVVELFLEVKCGMADMIYNRFGNEYKFENVGLDEEGNERGYVRIRVQLSSTFLRWIFGFQGGIKIVPPKSDMWIRTGSWGKIDTANRTTKELREDYDKAIKMYKHMLKIASETLLQPLE